MGLGSGKQREHTTTEPRETYIMQRDEHHRATVEVGDSYIHTASG